MPKDMGEVAVRVNVKGIPKGRKFWVALIWGAALIGVLLILLAFGVRSETIIIAWLAAFVAVPVQFGIANAAVSRAYAKAGGDQ